MLRVKHGVATVILISGLASSAMGDPLDDAGSAIKQLLGMGSSESTVATPRGVDTPAVGDVAEGEAAYDRGDYATALRLWRPLAERGDVRAQFGLGILYNNGQGVVKDYTAAHKWFSLAAAQGDKRAAEYRDIVAPNVTPQRQAAAPRGAAQPQTGETAYQNGDYATALRLWRPAAERGDATAQFNLGVMYNNGHGVPKDYSRAYMWFSLAAARGDRNAAQYRDTVEKSMPPVQIAEAQKLAREWKPNGARKEPHTTGSSR